MLLLALVLLLVPVLLLVSVLLLVLVLMLVPVFLSDSELAQKDVFLNIAGGLKVNDPAIDLPVISAILSSNMDAAIEPEVCMAGEIGLSGEIRPVNRIEQRIGEAEKLGFKRFLLPKYNLQGIDTQKLKIELVPVRKVEEAFRALFG